MKIPTPLKSITIILLVLLVSSIATAPLYAASPFSKGFDKVRALRDLNLGDASSQITLVFIILAIIQFLLAPAAVIAFGALLVGGYFYITSVGDEAKAGLAKRVILYALLGLAIIGIAGITVNAVLTIFFPGP